MANLRWYRDIGLDDSNLLVAKGAGLAELTVTALPVPSGFCHHLRRLPLRGCRGGELSMTHWPRSSTRQWLAIRRS